MNVRLAAGVSRPRRDVGGLVSAAVVGALALVLTAVSALWPATEPTPSDDRQPVTEQTRAIGDLAFTAVANGLGPVERNRANGGAAVDDGDPISISGQVFERGLGVFAPSRVRLYPGGLCTRFVAWIGVDDSLRGSAGAVFQIIGDDSVRYESERFAPGDPAREVEIDIREIQNLDLVVSSEENGTSRAAASWAEAALICLPE
ncbi:MAG: NPCBM/NEW2 domain-containing protein [Micromonosporaceae bacterium]|nr:NPCBM/NEW2 domain-containing protein [Micromonosporaceae bacterium]